MNRELTTLRIDLGINAQQIASQVMIDNKNLESHISKGIQLAIEELTDEDGFVFAIKEGTKKAILESINSATNSFEFRIKVQNAINDRLELKIKEYADSVAEKVFKEL